MSEELPYGGDGMLIGNVKNHFIKEAESISDGVAQVYFLPLTNECRHAFLLIRIGK